MASSGTSRGGAARGPNRPRVEMLQVLRVVQASTRGRSQLVVPERLAVFDTGLPGEGPVLPRISRSEGEGGSRSRAGVDCGGCEREIREFIGRSRRRMAFSENKQGYEGLSVS